MAAACSSSIVHYAVVLLLAILVCATGEVQGPGADDAKSSVTTDAQVNVQTDAQEAPVVKEELAEKSRGSDPRADRHDLFNMKGYSSNPPAQHLRGPPGYEVPATKSDTPPARLNEGRRSTYPPQSAVPQSNEEWYRQHADEMKARASARTRERESDRWQEYQPMEYSPQGYMPQEGMRAQSGMHSPSMYPQSPQYQSPQYQSPRYQSQMNEPYFDDEDYSDYATETATCGSCDMHIKAAIFVLCLSCGLVILSMIFHDPVKDLGDWMAGKQDQGRREKQQGVEMTSRAPSFAATEG